MPMRHMRVPNYVSEKLDKAVDDFLGVSQSSKSKTGVHVGRLEKFHDAKVPDILDVNFDAFKTTDGEEVPDLGRKFSSMELAQMRAPWVTFNPCMDLVS